MRKLLKSIYLGSDYGYILLNPLKRFIDHLKFLLYSDEKFITKAFKKNLGYDLNLEDPKTFNEKLQYLKLHDRTQLHTICADKLAVREYIKKELGEKYLIPLVFHTKNVKDINPKNLPEYPVIIKTNHESGSVVIVRDKSSINWTLTRMRLASSLKNHFYYIGREWQYKNIVPCIIVEKLLLDKKGNTPVDYKFHYTNAKLLFVQVDEDRFVKNMHKRTLFDENWSYIDCRWTLDTNSELQKPKEFEKMKKLAEKIAKKFDYVRIDFYNFDSKIYFGEITFHNESGWIVMSPLECDRKFGDKLILSPSYQEKIKYKRSLLKDIYKNTNYGYILINPIKRFVDYLKFLLYSDEVFVKKAFKKNLGYDLNLDNPKTFNEKLQWLKLNVQTDLHTKCADKLAVRDYIKEKIGEQYLIPLVTHTSNVEDINLSSLPDYPVVIKSNHDSGKVFIIRDKSIINWKVKKLILKGILKNNFYYIGREKQYKNIKPTILIEKLLLDKNNNIPSDYKLHCFNGKLLFTQVDKGRFGKHTRSYFDVDWNLMDCKVRLENEQIQKPKNIGKMQELAELLAKPFDYVRVDFYSFDDKIYFGELTFCPGSGWDYYSPISNDYNFGKHLKLTNFHKKGSK